MWTHLTRSNLHQNVEHHLASDGGEGALKRDEKHGVLHVGEHQRDAHDNYLHLPPDRKALIQDKYDK